MFKSILVANRGEIACRVFRACRELGIESIAIYSMADKDSRHVKRADRAICVGEGANSDSYLNLANVLMAAEISGAEAVHPGYGYFSERALFAEALATKNIAFIGPSVQAIRSMGDKGAAKQAAIASDCPVIPGSKEQISTEREAMTIAEEIGFPVLLKAVAGGGGRGIRRVDDADQLAKLWKMAQAEAQASFGNGEMLVEKCILEPRHIEIQILADHHGNTLYLNERECSIQNLRHQKILEEAPSAAVSPELRKKMGEAAVRVAEYVGYTNAGTVEFLLDANGDFYFLEMNTRIQVEHPVTEAVTGYDLVKWQIRIAAGEKLTMSQDEVPANGHAIEARITAQDPELDFAPSSGKITTWNPPGFGGVRLDSGVGAGSVVTPYYDPMIAKLIVHAPTREDAVRLMLAALHDFEVEGIKTNIPFLREIVADPRYMTNSVSTSFVPQFLEERRTADAVAESLA